MTEKLQTGQPSQQHQTAARSTNIAIIIIDNILFTKRSVKYMVEVYKYVLAIAYVRI